MSFRESGTPGLLGDYERSLPISRLNFPRRRAGSNASSARFQDRCAWGNAVCIPAWRAGSADGSDIPWEDELGWVFLHVLVGW